jgi:hypothetical protein
MNMKTNEDRTMKAIKQAYELCRVGQAVYVATDKTATARVVAVGRKWIRLAGGGKCSPTDVVDWWKG